jgi:ribosomal protein S18 acetylase RimI-like enzyme
MTTSSANINLLNPIIRELQPDDFSQVLTFSDEQIGDNYFTREKLEKIFQASLKNGIVTSLLLVDEAGIQGMRLTYPPGQWIDRHPSQPVHPELWKVELSDAAYFQSLFISRSYQGKGFGQKLSLASIEKLKLMGAKAVVCHSWNESPQNTSRKYLDRLGFEAVLSIPEFWKCIDYKCTRCGKPCVCSATEMVLYI